MHALFHKSHTRTSFQPLPRPNPGWFPANCFEPVPMSSLSVGPSLEDGEAPFFEPVPLSLLESLEMMSCITWVSGRIKDGHH